MTGFCGWMSASPKDHEVHNIAHRMLGQLLPGGRHTSIAENSTAAAAGAGAHSVIALSTRAVAGGTATVAGLQGVIHGRPHWQAGALAQLAREQGASVALLAAYCEHGTRCIEHIAGSFAYAILDPAAGQAFLAVDRLGIETLAYAITARGDLIFGSTASAVTAHPAVERTFDTQALFDYLYFHVVPSPGTVYREVRKLEPAQCLRLAGKHPDLSYYWKPSFAEQAGRSEPGLAQSLRGVLDAAVARCEPDVRTACFLSGGLDSSTVCGILARSRSEPVSAFSIGFAQSGYDEMHYARTAARHFGLKHREYYITHQDVADAIDIVAGAYDEPFGNSSAIPTLICARLASAEQFEVMLAGDGGDEIFGGNERYAKQRVFESYHALPRSLRERLIEPALLDSWLGRAGWPLRKLASYVQQARIPMPARTGSYNFLNRVELGEMFEDEFLADVDPAHPMGLLSDRYSRAPAHSLVNRMLYLDWKFTLADNDLRKVGRMCAVAGVEARYPFLDDEVVALANSVAPDSKVKGTRLRHFFRAAQAGFLPREILDKRKHGFGLPFGEWLKESAPLQERIYATLSAFKARRIVRPQFVDELIAAHRGGHAAYYGTMVWVIAMLEFWLQAHEH